MPQIKGVIFDWAGTTVDFGCFAPVNAFMDSFKQYGIEVTEEETRKPMGMLKIDHIKTMLAMPRISKLWEEKYGCQPDDDAAEKIYQHFEPMLLASLKNYSDVKPHVLETVAYLRSRGIKIGSTTGFNSKMMEIVTAAAKENGYVPDLWVTPDFVENYGRPYPYMVFYNMQQLKLAKTCEVIKVGDTVADIQEGKNAGVWSVGVVDGSSVMGLSKQAYDKLNAEELQQERARVHAVMTEAGADFVIDDLSQLSVIIARIEAM